MTWQPSDREVAAYIEGAGVAAMSDGLPAVNRAQYVARAGLQAAYERLEARVLGPDPTPTGFIRTDLPLYAPRQPTRPPTMQYADLCDLDEANKFAGDGWRLVHVYGPRDAPRYVMERERPEPSTVDSETAARVRQALVTEDSGWRTT